MNKYTIPLSKKNKAKISAQAEYWAKAVPSGKVEITGQPFITISRQFGCGAFLVAEALAERLNQMSEKEFPWAVYDRALVAKIADDHKLSEELVMRLSRKLRTELEESALGLLSSFTPEIKVYKSTVATVRALAMHGRVIIVGRGGAVLTRDIPGGLHIRLIAPLEWRTERVAKLFNMELKEAKDYVVRMDAEREKYISKYLGADIADNYHYDVIFNNSKVSTEKMVEAVVKLL
jgi:cytidylate kinase